VAKQELNLEPTQQHVKQSVLILIILCKIKMKKVKVIELSQPPNWPEEMVCTECRFGGWQWIGMTKRLSMWLSKGNIRKCCKCGCGLMGLSESTLPFFIFKK
jgi:hypothetical protein